MSMRLLRQLRLQADRAKDPFKDARWTRFPVDIIRTGLWFELPMNARKVYWGLLALVDPRTLETYRGISYIRDYAGLKSVGRTSQGLTSLRRHGVISRQRVRVEEWRPYRTRILSPRRWRWGDGRPVDRESAAPGGRV